MGCADAFASVAMSIDCRMSVFLGEDHMHRSDATQKLSAYWLQQNNVRRNNVSNALKMA